MKLNKINKRLVQVKVNDLKPFPGNPRHNTKSAKVVAKSIKEFGYINPIICTPDLVILAGNTRHKALKLLGVEDIDVLVIDGLTPEQIKGFVIADNRVGEYSMWNYSALDRMVSSGEADNEMLKDLGITSFVDNKKELEALINGE